jgi:hypothetical protein
METSRLWKLGFSTTEIAKCIGVSQPTIVNDLKLIRADGGHVRFLSRQHALNDLIDLQFIIINENWLAWQRSKMDAQETTSEEYEGGWPCKRCKGAGILREGNACEACEGTGVFTPPGKTVTKTWGRLPESVYMRNIMEAAKAVREMLGVDPPKESLVQAQVVNWDIASVVQSLPKPGDPPDEVEDRIDAIVAARVAERDAREGGQQVPISVEARVIEPPA